LILQIPLETFLFKLSLLELTYTTGTLASLRHCSIVELHRLLYLIQNPADGGQAGWLTEALKALAV